MFDVSGADLIKIANESIQGDSNKIKSKFAIIIATAKRVRQLIYEQDERLYDENPLTVAKNEFKNKSVSIVGSDE